MTVHARISEGVYPPEPNHIRPRWYRFKNVSKERLHEICYALAVKRNKVAPGKDISIIVTNSSSGEEVAFIHGWYYDEYNKVAAKNSIAYTLHTEGFENE